MKAKKPVMHASSFGKAERPLIVKALKHTKKNLWNGEGQCNYLLGQRPGICAASMQNNAPAYSETVRVIIGVRLGSNVYVNEWLSANGHLKGDFQTLSTDERLKAIQDYRHRWLDELIREFSE